MRLAGQHANIVTDEVATKGKGRSFVEDNFKIPDEEKRSGQCNRFLYGNIADYPVAIACSIVTLTG